MSNFKSADKKKEEFRKYLERCGVVDALTKILVNLYEEPEKPNNPIDVIKKYFGREVPESADVENLQIEVAQLKEKVVQLTDDNLKLKERLRSYEPEAGALTSEENNRQSAMPDDA
ncbi:hypothetical protein SNEBB_002241 [Seison nebaliae]|nr:hypothetical protein SNEBB_002241 [Seison nebaliae]